MSDGAPSPDWSRLPHDPRGFFGLGDGFDRRDLKRSYNRLLRMYKPEKAPAEFQKIRAAFEQLDNQLRYGIQAEAKRADYAAANEVWQKAIEVDGAPRRDGTREEPGRRPERTDRPPKTLVERLRTEPTARVYQDLANAQSKSPYDFYALATLSDLCDATDGLNYVRWVLAGLKAHPSDFALRRLLYGYLAGPQPAGALPRVLVAASKTLDGDAFYAVTEPAWEAMLRDEQQGATPLFLKTLKACEANLRGPESGARVTFTIRTARAALWNSDPGTSAWAADTVASVESQVDAIPDWLEYEVELLSVAAAYVQARRKFLNGDPVRAAMDRALAKYFTSDPAAGDHAIVEEQLALLADPDALLAAIPAEIDDDATLAAVNLWAWVTQEVAERHGGEDVPEDQLDMWFGRVRVLLSQCDHKSERCNLGAAWNYVGIAYLFLFAVATVIAPVLAGLAGNALASASGIGAAREVGTVAFIGCAMAGMLLSWKVIWPSRGAVHRAIARRIYLRFWRRDLLDFLSRSRLTYWMFREMLRQHADKTFTTSPWVSALADQDHALLVYALACRFQV